MSVPDVQITVLWENDCGEVIHEERLSADAVWKMVQEDMRAVWNRYVMPGGDELDSAEFSKWYMHENANRSAV